MLVRHANRTFAIALLLSLALHAALILAMPNPLGSAPVASAERRSVVPVRLTAPLPPPATRPDEPKEPESREIDLGLDAPAPPSKTWLGFTDYVQQLMKKSAVEQAAFTDDPVAASPPPSPPTPTPAPEPAEQTPPVQQPAEATSHQTPAPDAPDATKSVAPDDVADAPQPPPPQPTPQESPASNDDHSPEAQATSSDAHQQPQQPTDEHKSDSTENAQPPTVDESSIAMTAIQPISDATISNEPAAAATAESPADAKDSTTEDTTAGPSFADALTELAAQALEFAAQAAVKKTPDEHADQNPDQQPVQPQQQQPPPPVEPQPVISREELAGAPNHGAQSDRESDPSSTIDVPRDQWQLGRPLAAHGLEIKPRRPTLSILTTLTAWPANPLCKISFDRTGVPTRATLLRSTGDERVDSAIEASLYRWRAAGKPLETLRGEQTFDLTIRLLINPDRKRENGDG